MSVQTLIEQANKKTAASRKQVFAKKANDQQHHAFLLKHADVVLEIYHATPDLMNASNNFRAAMRELETAMTLSRRKLQP
ncbi:hypothetical protein UFOVP1419_22 [uncultured Caudovirales phage]|uniref:Uncharacterized protein n=1 Tax=uncultured Caudovirales phage TaxID=2100421 RepID=A0A6J5SD72_9CAUD|nr:hypothetical protein UFOVP1419_22 [uncultured Caudovirales phage]